MSRKYNVSKKKNKGVVGGVVAFMASILLVGGLGAVSKGFTDWNVGGWFDKTDKTENERLGLVVVDLKTTVEGSAFNTTSLISFLNEGLGKDVDPVFKDVAFIEKEVEIPPSEGETEGTTEIQKEYLLESVYKDNGGMKFGASSKLGSFTVNLVEGTTFNRAKIVGRNYSAKNNQTGIYSCDESSIILNGAEAQVFGTNAEDTTKEAPTEEKVFSFEDTQDQLSISVLGKRATLFTIELWTEIAETAK